jgi:hypothetical protein
MARVGTRIMACALLAAALSLPAGAAAREARELEWLDLLPPEDLEAIQRLPQTMEELNQELLEKGIDEWSDDVQMPDVLTSTNVVDELAGEYVRLPGFLVPLEMNERGEAHRFFLVPYFGACIHTPPPPPNQMVHITFSGGLPDHGIYIPYWIVGELEIERTENPLGIATYAIDAERITEFE